MKCNIIKDLLPSYVDGICSEDTIEIVEEHLQKCEACKLELNMMQTDYVREMPAHDKNASTPFRKINNKRRIQVIIATLLTFSLTVIGAMIIQEVGVVNQIFFPMKSAIIEIDTVNNKQEWESLSFEREKYLRYKGVFWNKEITNDANNESEILLRVKDEEGNIIIDELKILPGTSVKLKELERNENYLFEIKAENGRYLINAT